MPRGRQSQSGSSATTRVDRRHGERVAAVVKFKVHGADASFSGETVNVSRTGALLWITDEQFVSPEDAINMVCFSERVAEVLGDGMRLELEGGIVRQGEVVRVSRRSEAGTAELETALSPLLPGAQEWQEARGGCGLSLLPPERKATALS